MGWRTLVITGCCKLDLRLGNLNIRRQDQLQQVHIGELSQLIIESTAVSLTSALLSELMKQKVKVLFCDEQHNPQSELVPYYGSYDCSARIRAQITWTEEAKQSLWTRLVFEKIKWQRALLQHRGLEEEGLLGHYLDELQPNDLSNREGHAAKVYFNALFGQSFSRDDEGNVLNRALDYGYSLLLSILNREIIANGYLTQLGVFHRNQFNPFNLSCDLMEPLRPLVDAIVVEEAFTDFGRDEKRSLLSLFQKKLKVSGRSYYLDEACRIYVKAVLDALDAQKIQELKFVEYEF